MTQQQPVAANSEGVESSMLPKSSKSISSWCRYRICSMHFILHSRKIKSNHHQRSRNILRFVHWKLLFLLFFAVTITEIVENMRQLILKESNLPQLIVLDEDHHRHVTTTTTTRTESTATPMLRAKTTSSTTTTSATYTNSDATSMMMSSGNEKSKEEEEEEENENDQIANEIDTSNPHENVGTEKDKKNENETTTEGEGTEEEKRRDVVITGEDEIAVNDIASRDEKEAKENEDDQDVVDSKNLEASPTTVIGNTNRTTEKHQTTIDNAILEPIQRSGIMYSICRADRSGSVVMNMLAAHAFAYANNVTYGGACCVTKGVPKRTTVSLLHDLHWDQMLPFACPAEVDRSQYNVLYPNATEIHPTIINSAVYRDIGEETFNKPSWRQHVQTTLQNYKILDEHSLDSNSSRSMTNSRAMDEKKYYNIAVHVRRGDVNPCRYVSRYLPNSHYLSLIDQYTPTDPNTLNGRTVKVTIYSESDSFESFDEFIQRNFTLELDGDNLANVWKAISIADVAILSRSSFSIIPALMNPNIVVATDYVEFNVHGFDEIWNFASPELLKNTKAQISNLRETRC